MGQRFMTISYNFDIFSSTHNTSTYRRSWRINSETSFTKFSNKLRIPSTVSATKFYTKFSCNFLQIIFVGNFQYILTLRKRKAIHYVQWRKYTKYCDRIEWHECCQIQNNRLLKFKPWCTTGRQRRYTTYKRNEMNYWIQYFILLWSNEVKVIVSKNL